MLAEVLSRLVPLALTYLNWTCPDADTQSIIPIVLASNLNVFVSLAAIVLSSDIVRVPYTLICSLIGVIYTLIFGSTKTS